MIEKIMQQARYQFASDVQVIHFPWLILSLALILFMEITQMNDANHKKTTNNVTKKQKIGTKITLLVLLRKSAEASITSIASLSDLNPTIMQHKNMAAISENPIIPYNKQLCILEYDLVNYAISNAFSSGLPIAVSYLPYATVKLDLYIQQRTAPAMRPI